MTPSFSTAKLTALTLWKNMGACSSVETWYSSHTIHSTHPYLSYAHTRAHSQMQRQNQWFRKALCVESKTCINQYWFLECVCLYVHVLMQCECVFVWVSLPLCCSEVWPRVGCIPTSAVKCCCDVPCNILKTWQETGTGCKSSSNGPLRDRVPFNNMSPNYDLLSPKIRFI